MNFPYVFLHTFATHCSISIYVERYGLNYNLWPHIRMGLPYFDELKRSRPNWSQPKGLWSYQKRPVLVQGPHPPADQPTSDVIFVIVHQIQSLPLRLPRRLEGYCSESGVGIQYNISKLSST